MRHRMKATLGLLLLACAISGNVLATTIGDVATNLMGPTEIITKLVIVACYIVGLTLVFVAMAQYKIHTQSPKLVPLSTPILLLILGIIALLIPYVTGMFETGNAASHSAGQSEKNNLLPLPGEANLPGLPRPKHKEEPAPTYNEPAPEQAPPPPAAPSSPPPSKGGGWTADPRYQ